MMASTTASFHAEQMRLGADFQEIALFKPSVSLDVGPLCTPLFLPRWQSGGVVGISGQERFGARIEQGSAAVRSTVAQRFTFLARHLARD